MQHSPRCVPRPFFSFSPCHRSSSAATHLTQRFSLPLSCVPPCMFVCEAIYICLVGPRTQRARVTAERGTFLLFRGTAAVPCVGNQITFRAGNMCAAALSIILILHDSSHYSVLCVSSHLDCSKFKFAFALESILMKRGRKAPKTLYIVQIVCVLVLRQSRPRVIPAEYFLLVIPGFRLSRQCGSKMAF